MAMNDEKPAMKHIKDFLSKIGSHTNSINYLGSTLLNVLDVGGQPGFLELLPALSSGPAMYLIFTDLSKELDKCYEISFDRDGKAITPYNSKYTIKATISQVYSLQ